MPTSNNFIKDSTKHFVRPDGNPGENFPFVLANFDDVSWEKVNLPHDWAIKDPFYEEADPEVGGGMGRLPSHGVAWYRKKLDCPESDSSKSIFLDIDGAMSYAIVWLNGKLVGGWPYGYNSWRVDLTPYIDFGKENQLAIRVDNPNNSARWYPGGGLYRNVWLTKVNPVHVAQWGTFISTPTVTEVEATINLELTVENDSKNDAEIKAVTKIFELDKSGFKIGNVIAEFKEVPIHISAGKKSKISDSLIIVNPKLWGPYPTQTPNRYIAVTELYSNGELIDQYETKFGISRFSIIKFYYFRSYIVYKTISFFYRIILEKFPAIIN